MPTVWTTSVSEMMSIFRDGLLAVLPIAERARIPWSDERAYDDWETIAGGLYDAIVRMSLSHSEECKDCTVAKYGFGPGDRDTHLIIAEFGSSGASGAFVSLSSRNSAFSHVRVKTRDNNSDDSYFAFESCQFFVRAANSSRAIRDLTVAL